MSSKDILGLGWTTERKTSIAAADRHKLLSITDDGTKSLPALADVDFAWSCLVFAEHGNGITLDPDGSELINGVSTIVLAEDEWALVYKIDASNWGAMTKGSGGGGGGAVSGATLVKTSDQTGISNGGTVTWDSAAQDVGSLADLANDSIVADKDGWWLATAHLQWNSQTTSDDSYFSFRVNGGVWADPASEARYGRDQAAIAFPGREGTALMNLSASDNVIVNVVGDGSFTVRSSGAYFSLIFLGDSA